MVMDSLGACRPSWCIVIAVSVWLPIERSVRLRELGRFFVSTCTKIRRGGERVVVDVLNRIIVDGGEVA